MDPLRQLICLLVFFIFTSGVQEEEMILWESGRKLNWSDFKAVPPASMRVAATTASGISYSFRTRLDNGQYKLKYRVETYFYPNKSWYHKTLCDSVVLSHEQLHFDISELFARKMERILDTASFSRNVKGEVRRIFKEINRELSEYQDRYDQETDYSRNREAQERWSQLIGQKLKD